jgi:hypothetical protein
MNSVIMTLALVVAPVAAFAQQVPQPLPRPLPGTDSLGVPPVVLALTSGGDPARAALVGAVEGAAAGAAGATTLTERRRDCSPAVSPGQGGAEGAVFGGVLGGLRGLLGWRHGRVPTVLAKGGTPKVAPRPDPNRRTPDGPPANTGCVALPANVPAGDTR